MRPKRPRRVWRARSVAAWPCVLNPPRGTFHPKLYIARHGDRLAAVRQRPDIQTRLWELRNVTDARGVRLAEAKLDAEDVYWGARLACAEMIRSGVTAFADMYYFEEEIARETKAAGLRGVLGQTVIRFPVADAKTPAEGLARTEAFLKEFAADELITPALAPASTASENRRRLSMRSRARSVRSSSTT